MTIRVQYKVFLQIKINTCSPASLQLSAVGFGVPNYRSVEQSAAYHGWSCRPRPPGPCGHAAPKAKLSKLRRSADRCPTRRRDPPECPTRHRRTAKAPPWPVAGRWALAQRRRRRQTTRLLHVQLLLGLGRRKLRVRGMRACGSAEAELSRYVASPLSLYV